MKRFIALLFLLIWLVPNVAFPQAFTFPNNPVVGQEVTGPGGVIYRWDGTAWVVVLPAPGLPINNPQFTGTLTGSGPGSILIPPSGTFTLPDTSTWTSTGLSLARPLNITTSAFSPANRSAFVFNGGEAAITHEGGTLAISGGANYSGGSTWVAGPASTGASVIDIRPNGINFYSNTGLTGGAAFSPTPLASFTTSMATFSVPLVFNSRVTYQATDDWNLARDIDGMQHISVRNDSGGPLAQAAFNLRNNAGLDVWFVQEGPGYVNNGDQYQQPNSSGILSGVPFWIAADGGALDYYPEFARNMAMDRYGLRLISDNPVRSQMYFDAPDGNVWASFTSAGEDNLNIAAGAYYDSGAGWYLGAGSSTAQLVNLHGANEIGFHLAHSQHGTAGWVRNGYFAHNALYVWSTQEGGQYNLGVTGTVRTWARPWEGRQALNSVTELWVCGGCCSPVSTVSGILFLTEKWYRGHSGLYALGGGGAGWAGSSEPSYSATRTFAGNSCGPSYGNASVCFSGIYYLCNNIGADSVFGVMMLETRNTV